MKKILSVSLGLLCWGHALLAQKQTLYASEQYKKIQAVATNIAKLEKDSYTKALALATKNNWLVTGSHGKGKQFALTGLDDTGQPLYLSTYSNAQASATTKTNTLYAGGSLGLSLNGNSSFMSGKLGVWDGGQVLDTHVELTGRVTQQDSPSSTSEHSTHVAGTMIASGVSAIAKGMAFGANLKAWDYNSDNSEMSAAASGLLVSNHSYGYLAGWNYDDTKSAWRWMGNTSISTWEDYKFGFYDSYTQAWDKIAYNAPYYLIVKSAGNNRGETGPSAGTVYYLGNTTDTSTVARSKNDGYDVISTTGTAKNILTVGAINPIDHVPFQNSEISIADFSSWGPTDDGRIKPDIVGVGVNIYSTSNASSTSYTIMSGTSMATPQVAGSLLLLQELYAKQNSGQFMRSATLKGLALHTADDAGNAGPDYIYGWGLLNMEKAAKVILNKDATYALTERTLSQGGTYTEKVVASGKEPLHITICWTDPEASITSVSVANLNNRTPKLVNDLDIRVSDGTSNYLPFILDPSKPSALATTGDNIRDNVEQILITNPIPGRTYTVTVSHKGTLTNTSQNYALIMSGVGGKAYCATTPQTQQTLINSVSFGTNNTVSINQKYSLKIGFNTGTKSFKVFADWNVDGDFDDTNEALLTENGITATTYTKDITTPTGLVVGNAINLRVICTSASTASAITSCGIADKGQIVETSLQVVNPMYDLVIKELVAPTTSLTCANTAVTKVGISLYNAGTSTLKNIPLTLKISNSSSTITTLTGTLTDTIGSFQTKIVYFTTNFTPISGEKYSFNLVATLASDQDQSTNNVTFTRQVTTPTAPTASVVACSGGSTATIKTISTTDAFWYDQATGGNLLFSGSTGSFTKPSSNKVYVMSGGLSGSVGVKSKADLGGGTYYENFGPSIIMTTQVPILLKTARIYVGTAGKITFTVSKMSDNTPVSSVTLDLAATRTLANSTRSSSQLIEDATDQGVVVDLNLSIPEAGTYLISQTCSDGASIYRSNKNLSSTATDIVGYPFTLSSSVSITGAYYNGSVIKTGYYYLYDINVGSLTCASARTEVSIQNQAAPSVSVTPASSVTFCSNANTTLTATNNANYSYQWYKDSQSISGATQNTYVASSAGSYTVTVTENGACTATSTAVKATTVSPITPSLNLSNGILSISSGTNAYWYVNGTELTASQGKSSITTTQTGTYSVKVTDANGCSATSSSVNVTITAIEAEVAANGGYKIFPNPTRGKVTVQVAADNFLSTAQAELISVTGTTVEKKALDYQQSIYTTDFDLASLAAGIYFIRVTTDNYTKILKVSFVQ